MVLVYCEEDTQIWNLAVTSWVKLATNISLGNIGDLDFWYLSSFSRISKYVYLRHIHMKRDLSTAHKLVNQATRVASLGLNHAMHLFFYILYNIPSWFYRPISSVSGRCRVIFRIEPMGINEKQKDDERAFKDTWLKPYDKCQLRLC